MADKGYIAFIVEGEVREKEIIENVQEVFFPENKYKVISLPASQNIYMLWKRLKEDDLAFLYQTKYIIAGFKNGVP